MSRSRRQRRFEGSLKKNLLLSVLGIFVVFFVLFKFGIPLLVNFVLLFSNQPKIVSQNVDSIFLSSPVLDPLPQATNSAKIIISGVTTPDVTVALFVNDKRVDDKDVGKKGEFSFEHDLSKGGNKIYARSEKDDEKSDTSDPVNVIYDDTPPTLEISSPTDNQSFSKDQNSVNVNGKTEEEARITVNGFWAIVSGNNTFSYNLPLQNGENKIKVVATDLAGNITEKEIKVNYSP